MRRQVTVGGLVALALLTGSVVAYAAQPAPPGQCAPVAAEDASPGLVPFPRVAGQDEPDPDGEDHDPDDDGEASDDHTHDPDDGDEPVDGDPVDGDPADEDPADEDPAEDSADGSDGGSGDDASGGDPGDAGGEDQAADHGDDSGGSSAGEEAGDTAGVDAPAGATPRGAAPGEDPAGATDEPGADEPATDAPASDARASDAPAVDACASPTAAEALGWGEPAAVDEFDGPPGGDWRIYSGSGFDGHGTRTADALAVDDGVLTITGDEAGATGGMAWAPGQEYGRWEARVRTPESDPSYNALLLLWPDDPAAAGSDVGSGEIDFMEMLDPTRQTANAFVHPGTEAAPVMGEVEVDGTAWHTWAVEWTPTAVTTYLDGVRWWSVDDPALLPSGPMHLCVQLDWFPTGAGEVRESSMQVDWVRQYPLDAPADDAGTPAAPTGSTAAPADGGGGAPAAGAPAGGPAAAPVAGGPAVDPEADDPATDPEAGVPAGHSAAGAPASDGHPGSERLSEGAPDAPAGPGLVPRAVRGA